jgi:hypothetical protein
MWQKENSDGETAWKAAVDASDPQYILGFTGLTGCADGASKCLAKKLDENRKFHQ